MNATITINMDVKCTRCGKPGATSSGLCMDCIAKGIQRGDYDQKIKAATQIGQMPFPDEPAQKQPTVEELQKNIAALLKIIGDAALCSSCGAEIWWVVNPKTGKRMPITKTGVSHFSDCPQAKSFRKAK